VAAATVTSKGQVTLPVEARRRLGIRAGTRLEFIVKDDDRLDVVRVGGSIRDLKGLLPKPRRKLSLDEMEQAIASGARGREP
jgi:AbrB family looped-hinge helix DNA binding protein